MNNVGIKWASDHASGLDHAPPVFDIVMDKAVESNVYTWHASLDLRHASTALIKFTSLFEIFRSQVTTDCEYIRAWDECTLSFTVFFTGG